MDHDLVWLEVIRVRAATPCTKEVLHVLANLLELAPAEEGAPEVSVYVHRQVEGDVAVHLGWRRSPEACSAGALGAWIAERLRTLGLVDHALWERLPG